MGSVPAYFITPVYQLEAFRFHTAQKGAHIRFAMKSPTFQPLQTIRPYYVYSQLDEYLSTFKEDAETSAVQLGQ